MLDTVTDQLFCGTFRTADRTRLAVQVQGSGPALLLLPGQANSHHWWDAARGDFVADRTTVTFDYRGTGSSDDPETPYSTEQFAQDALAVLDYLCIPAADVYGTSMGGKVATWIAVDAPRRVNKLVLGCTTPGGPNSVQRSDGIRKALATSSGSTEALIDLMYTPAYRAEHAGPYATLGDPAMTPRARIQHLKASNEHDAWDALPDIAAETLVLHGTEDLLTPYLNGALLAQRIPNARLHTFSGARHAYFEECGSQASRVVLEFLTATHSG